MRCTPETLPLAFTGRRDDLNAERRLLRPAPSQRPGGVGTSAAGAQAPRASVFLAGATGVRGHQQRQRLDQAAH
jgi:hypothetical protein